MLRSIRARLVLSYVLLILLTLGVVGAAILRLVEGHARQQERDYLAANAEAVAYQARSLLWPGAHQAELQELAETFAFLGNVQVRILNAGEQVVADSHLADQRSGTWILLPSEWRIKVPKGFPTPYILELPLGRRSAFPARWVQQSRVLEQLPAETRLTILSWQSRAWGGGFEVGVLEDPADLGTLAAQEVTISRSDRVLTVPIGNAEAPLGHVELSNGPDFVGETLRTVRRAFAYGAIGAMILAIVVGVVVSRGLVSPLHELARVTGRMSSGDLSSRAPVHRQDELGQLAGQFNLMAERLESSFGELSAERDALRRFIADASHELRTPITALRNFNDLLLGVATDDPAAQAEFLEESRAQIDRLEWVTRHLLDLSRLDAGLVKLDVGVHDAGELIASSSSAFRPLANEREITFSVCPPASSLEICCDRSRIEVALSNLLDNAFKFTPAGGTVEIGAEPAGNGARLWVRDTGPGIDEEERPRIFERFYRGQQASAEGSGLGLAIVQSIVQAHGGQVSVESEPGDGSLFTVQLPWVPGCEVVTTP